MMKMERGWSLLCATPFPTNDTTMKRYYDLTEAEKLALSGEAIHDSIRLEAIHRGIKPPVTLGSIINQHGFQGFTVPADSVVFYELCTASQYGRCEGSGLAYKTEAEARRALEGAVSLFEDGYGSTKQKKLAQGDISYQAVFLTLQKPKNFAAELESYCQGDDDSNFERLSEEIRKELNALWQASYDKKVRQEKRKEYLRLAQNDEAIAQAFWSKTERDPWPEAEEV